MQKPKFMSPTRLFVNYRKSAVPSGGWTQESFAGPAGMRLVRDMLTAQRAAKLKGARMLSAPLAALMKAQVIWVIDTVERRLRASYGFASASDTSAKSTVGYINVAQHADLWAAAIEEAFSAMGGSVTATVQPALQSAADDVLERTTTLLTGGKPGPGARRVLQQEVNEIAKQVTNINETTRNRLSAVVRKGIDAGDSPFAVMEAVRKKIPEIATNRVPTIVRTEMGRAVDRAALRSMKESAVVTHVSVTGCEAVEKGIPTWNGIPTCNIKNVPIASSGDLHFHINHTGSIVASGFKQRDGGTPKLPPRQGTPVGTWEDRGRPVPAIINEQPPKPPANAPKPPSSPSPALVPPPAPKPVPVAPDPVALASKVDDVTTNFTRRKVGGLSTSWTPPTDATGVSLAIAELSAQNINLRGASGMLTADDFKRFHDMFQMSPTDLKEHILGGPSAASKFAHTSFDFFVSGSGRRATIEGILSLEFGEAVSVVRQINLDGDKGKTVEHAYLTIPRKYQKDGVGKQLSTAFLKLYDHLGLDAITIHANIDVGGYAWARYGFVPNRNMWPGLKERTIERWNQLSEAGRNGFFASVDTLGASVFAEIEEVLQEVYDNDDPYDIRLVAALKQKLTKSGFDKNGNPTTIESTVGKELLLGSDWYGAVKLNDPDDYSNYRKYIE